MTKTQYKEIIWSTLPAIVFYLVYKIFSYKYAILIGFLLGFYAYGHKYTKHKKLSTFDKIGVFGLLTQTVIGLIAENPKIYFLYPLAQNIVFASVFLISLIIDNDAISYIAKDFSESEEILKLCKPTYRRLTLIWGLYFTFKIVVKVIGLIKLSFDQLYIINWILGTPGTALLLIYSFWLPNKYFKSLEEHEVV